MHALAAMPHVVIGRTCRIVPLVMLAWSRQNDHRRMDIAARRRRHQVRGSLERRAHQSDRAEHVGTHQRAPRGNRRAKIVPDHRGNRAASQRVYQPKLVTHRIQQAERIQIRYGVVVRMPAGGAAITAQIRCDDMVPGLGQRRHDPAPRIREFGKPVQQQHAGPIAGVETGLQDMHAQSVDIGHETRANAGGQHGAVERCEVGHRAFSHACARSNAASIRSWRALIAARSPACVRT